jgi:hypothetical protein
VFAARLAPGVNGHKKADARSLLASASNADGRLRCRPGHSRVTAVAARTAGWTRPGCQPQPWTAPWRALARDARRREALLSWQVARVHMPGRRNDRRRPRRSAALWGLWLLSTSPPLAVPPAARSVWLRFYALQFSATHTQAPAFPTPGALRHKRNRIRTLRIISGPDARCPCPAGGVTRRHTGTVCLYITYTR